MSVIKMEFVNIVGPLGAFEPFIISHIINNNFETENAINVTENVKGLEPFSDTNQFGGLMNRLDSMNEYFGIKPHNVSVPDMVCRMEDIIENANVFADELEKKIKEYKANLSESKNNIEKSKNILSRVIPMIELDVDLEVMNMNFFSFRFGRMSYENYTRLNLSLRNMEVIVFPLKREGEDIWLTYYMPSKMAPEIDSIFTSLYFESTDLSEAAGGTPREAASRLEENIKRLNNEIVVIEDEFKHYITGIRKDFDEVYSCVYYLFQTSEIKKHAAHTNDCFYLSGWIPKGSMDQLAEKSRHDGITFFFKSAESVKNIKTPTALKNPWIIKPFEYIVRTYGTPAHNELDPTLFVALTYVIMFGIMFGDVGHGFILALVGIIITKAKKTDLARIMTFCGLSSVIFGFLYGSVFGSDNILKPLYKNPMTNIMDMLVASVIFGVCTILIAMVLNVVNSIRTKSFKDILFDKNGIAGLIFYLGGIIYALSYAVKGKAITSFVYIAIFFIAPLILLFLKEPLHKLISGKKHGKTGMLEAFFEVFEAVLSFLSNTLSFVRLGAFALSHAGLSIAVWSIYRMTTGIAGGVIALVIGNILIIALEGLVVGIQGLRLQYYELFSRFFKGNGREYKPVKITDKK